ncbi:M48 family metalloprotease [Bartonella melophagi]|uniref:Peptidase M48 domain-containing protein n=1 Tax=Bartonella melophagi K-2C TaxID=1094557 RepID=J0R0V9_9HYPH|nr:M48 family metalloprotease [Bartonella melophagi]EJF92096.1 hypothetical protein ME3_00319 [Bartonella melophagi K-2C]
MIQGIRFLIQSIKFFQQIDVFSKIWSIAIISFLFLLSACHTAFQVNNKLHSSRSPVTKGHTGEIVDQTNNKNNLYTTLGATYHSRILQTYGGQYYNPKLEHMLAKIVNRLTAASQNPDQTYHVTILDTENINAFALPGSYIYVTRGMLALANDTSEVAAILAHEIAHITANHGILRLQKEIELKLAEHAATNILEHSSTKSPNILKDKKQLAQFTRSQELQADSIGIEMLNQAGYDPFAFPRFLKSMEAYSAFRNSSSSTNVSLDFLATHPTTPQRIQLAIKKAHEISAPNIGETDRDSFLKYIDGMIFGGNLHKGYIRGNQFIHPQLHIAFSVPNNFTINTSGYAVVASGPDKTAIRFDAVPLPENMSASDYLKSGWVAGLDQASVKSTTIQGLAAAYAHASNEHWQFDVVVIPIKDQVLRFLTAAPHHPQNFNHITKRTIESFHLLSSRVLNKLKPLRLRVIRIKKGESVADLAEKMQDTVHKEKLFRIINALSPTQILHEGERVKIIAE